MIRNYLKTAFRNLWKNKTFGFLNIVGLGVGIACAALIMLWVEDEVNYNSFIPNKEHIYQLLENQSYDAKTYTFSALPGLLAAAMEQEMPEIKNASRMYWGTQWLFTLGDKEIYEDGNFVDPSFFQIFSLKFLKGDPTTAFSQVQSVVITEKMAKKFFGDENPLGKNLKVNNEKEYTVTGVLEDLPMNSSSSLKFQWLASFKIMEDKNPWTKDWNTNGVQIYAELQPSADPKKVDEKLHGFIQSHDTTATAHAFLFPVKDWRLRFNFEEGKQVGGRIEYVRLFSIIALIILIIACINFMNLATARSEQRAREVGVRKVMGAGRGMLVSQFMGESLFMSFLSGFLAIIIILLALNAFNRLVDKQLSVNLLNPVHALGLISICLISGLVAGSYPSLYLSSFNPISVFKGFNAGARSSAAFIRKGLVISQFVISIVLIIATVIIYQQIQHVKNRPLGYNKDDLIYLESQGRMKDHFDAIRQDLLASGAVQNAALSNSRLLELGSSSGGFEWEGKDPKSDVLISTEAISPQYISTTGMQLKEGRDFYEQPKADTSSIIINETLERIMGKGSAVGKIIKSGDEKVTVVGVVKDFIYSDMYKKPDPLMFFCGGEGHFNYMFIRLKDGYDIKEALAKTGDELKKDNPGYPFEYKFFDEEFDKQFKSEMLVGTLSRLFAILAIFITCLGLFGLAAFTAERRTREIGIRKVLGATLTNIVTILSRDFLKLVSIAALLAFPLAWLIMNKWLQDYAYRVTINWWVFVLSGIAALIITLFTVSFQAIKAGMMNPVKSLRTE